MSAVKNLMRRKIVKVKILVKFITNFFYSHQTGFPPATLRQPAKIAFLAGVAMRAGNIVQYPQLGFALATSDVASDLARPAPSGAG